MSSSTNTEIATLDEAANRFPVLAEDNDLSEIMEANVGEEMSEFDLDRVKIPAGGGTTWEVPTLEGEESAKALDGIIVHWKNARAYWDSGIDESGGGSPPDCASRDGVHGSGMFGEGSEANPSGLCETCPMSEFGSAEGDSRAQACKQMRVLFIAREEEMLPLVLTVPPTSIKPLRQYFLRLAGKKIPHYGTITRLELEKATNAAGISYARLKPSVVQVLDRESALQAREYGDAIRDLMESQPIDVDAVRSSEEQPAASASEG